jgi:hypothetical protein
MRSTSAAAPFFSGLLQSTESGQDQPGRGRRRAGGLAIAAIAIPTDHLDVGMRRQPTAPRPRWNAHPRRRSRCVVPNRPRWCRSTPFALGPFIDADHPRLGGAGLGAPFHPTQEGVVAHREPDPSGQSFAGPPAERVADQARDDIRPARPPPAHSAIRGRLSGVILRIERRATCQDRNACSNTLLSTATQTVTNG